mmetsp:Transcript_12346/g.31186  ORF Transcript_12346/g.31186 Transcript_12346/m.31186 type:complete len:229 (-) Transcript_12346:732-1418(-)
MRGRISDARVAPTPVYLTPVVGRNSLTAGRTLLAWSLPPQSSGSHRSIPPSGGKWSVNHGRAGGRRRRLGRVRANRRRPRDKQVVQVVDVERCYGRRSAAHGGRGTGRSRSAHRRRWRAATARCELPVEPARVAGEERRSARRACAPWPLAVMQRTSSHHGDTARRNGRTSCREDETLQRALGVEGATGEVVRDLAEQRHLSLVVLDKPLRGPGAARVLIHLLLKQPV